MSNQDQWYSVFLGNGQDAYQPTLDIQNKFFFARALAGAPYDMAMFSKSKTNTGEHGVTLYFSPAAGSFAQSLAGSLLCDKPPKDHLGLLLGDARCWDVLFPPNN